MGLLLTTVAGLCLWIGLWSIGVNSVDAFLFVPGLLILAALWRTGRQSWSPPSWGVRSGSQWQTGSQGRVGLMGRAWIAGVVLAAVGLSLWAAALASTNDAPARLGELGAGLLSGAVVAFAVLFLERQFDRRAEIQSLRVTIGLQSDLTDIDLSGEQLQGFSFQGKTLTRAELSDANLRYARFGRAVVERTRFVGADLTGAVFSQAKLAGASFAAADITGAIFTDARDVDTADFKTAHYNRGKPPRFSGTRPDGIVQTPA